MKKRHDSLSTKFIKDLITGRGAIVCLCLHMILAVFCCLNTPFEQRSAITQLSSAIQQMFKSHRRKKSIHLV